MTNYFMQTFFNPVPALDNEDNHLHISLNTQVLEAAAYKTESFGMLLHSVLALMEWSFMIAEEWIFLYIKENTITKYQEDGHCILLEIVI